MHCNEQNSLPVALWFALLDAFDNTLMLPSSHPLRDACPGVQLQRDTCEELRNTQEKRNQHQDETENQGHGCIKSPSAMDQMPDEETKKAMFMIT
jgi:hypothetical protein